MNKKILALILILVSFIPLFNLLKPGYYGHDFIEHTARLSSFFQSLEQGNLIPRWAGNLNYGFGHPVFNFLYPLPSYLGSFFHFWGFGWSDSIKLELIFSYVLSGFFMYLWLLLLVNPPAAFLGACLYLFAPYRFVNLYVRGALGEHLAYAFLPLLCYWLTCLKQKLKPKFISLSGLAVALLILSHNLLSLVFLTFSFFYAFLLGFGFKNKIKYWLYCFLAFLLGLGLSAFFWLPAFWEGKYTLSAWIPLADDYLSRFVSLPELFWSKWDYGQSAYKGLSGFNVSVGIWQWLVFFIALFFVFYQKGKVFNQLKNLVFFLIGYFLIGIFLVLPISGSLTKFFPFIYKFQFPWRFLAMPLVSASILGAIIFNSLIKKKSLLLAFCLSLLVVITTASYWQGKKIDQDLSNEGVEKYSLTSTTETGESSPIWGVRFQEEFPQSKVVETSGNQLSLKINNWDFEKHIYYISLLKDGWLADNTLYFPGWKVFVDGIETPIEFQNQNWRGIITFPVSSGNHEIVVKFTNTKIRIGSEYLSIAVLLISLLIFVYDKSRR